MCAHADVLACGDAAGAAWAQYHHACQRRSSAFRDQLQNVMALCVAKPEAAREHLLRAAARQFAEGDVQHRWLPPSGQGIRTRMTDDRISLPFVAVHYMEVTADATVLDKALSFVCGRGRAWLRRGLRCRTFVGSGNGLPAAVPEGAPCSGGGAGLLGVGIDASQEPVRVITIVITAPSTPACAFP